MLYPKLSFIGGRALCVAAILFSASGCQSDITEEERIRERAMRHEVELARIAAQALDRRPVLRPDTVVRDVQLEPRQLYDDHRAAEIAPYPALAREAPTDLPIIVPRVAPTRPILKVAPSVPVSSLSSPVVLSRKPVAPVKSIAPVVKKRSIVKPAPVVKKRSLIAPVAKLSMKKSPIRAVRVNQKAINRKR